MVGPKRTAQFLFHIWLALTLLVVLVVSFVYYVFAEKEIDRANDFRHQSLLLAGELRQSSDDLTRMVRSYVTTSDPRYKEYYLDILAIRDGKLARPANYRNVYWDLMLVGKQPKPTGDKDAISLLELMRQAGFPEQEFQSLAEAKTNSDALSATEQKAIQLVDSAAANELESKRSMALSLLFGDNYDQAKAAIMAPIKLFLISVDKRTEHAVVRAEENAAIMRLAFIGVGLGMIFSLWRLNQILRLTLGGTLNEVYTQITRLGHGDFSAEIPLTEMQKNSILGWLATTQHNLQNLRKDRLRAESAQKASETRFSQTFKLIPHPLTLQTADGILIDCSDSFCAETGYEREDIIGTNTLSLGLWVYPEQRAIMRTMLVRDGQIDNFEFQLRRRDGTIRIVQISARYLAPDPEPILLSVAYDITDRRQAESSLREAVLHTQAILDNMFDGVITIDTNGTMESFNKAASRIFGHSADEVIGRNVSLLMPESYYNQHNSYLQNHLETSEQHVISKVREVEGLRKDGSRFPMSLSISKIISKGQVTFIGLIRDISQQREDEEEINRLAFYDPLTNLPNRRLLFDRLQQAILTSCRTDQHGALMFLDLDHFKQLNDNLGHDIGDLLLQQVGARLQACLREGDTVARMGGDEFVMLLEALSPYANEAASQAEAIAHKILAALNHPYDLNSHTYNITPSVGIVVFLHQTESMDELLKRADVAMYQAKAAGRNNARFFDPTMQAAASVRLQLEKSMRIALQRNEFLLHYQLQVNSRGVPTGVEALIRWNHPEHGMISPASFIPMAEETGMILPLGQWVLETACTQLVTWSKIADRAHWTVAVNVSAMQFTQPDFVTNIDRALVNTGANPSLLKLEITESMLAKDIDDVIVKMFEIKALGVKFSLDDFGTGYSSLTYLKRLPLDQLKIDQSFVRDLLSDPNDAVVARTIVALGHSLSLNVIAEGVETVEQKLALADMGCDAFQGYYFAHPVIAKDLSGVMNKIPTES